MACGRCGVWRLGVCDAMRDESAIASLEQAHLPLRVLQPDAVIYRQGDPPGGLYNLVSGWVVLQQTLSDGRSGLARFVLPGEFFGFGAGPHALDHTARTITAACVCPTPRARHARLRRDYPHYDDRFLSLLDREVQLAHATADNVALGSAQHRLAHLLWSLAIRHLHRRPNASGERIWTPLSQIQLAAATGLTPVHVSRMMRKMREEGLLHFDGHWLVVRDATRLERLSGIGEELTALYAQSGGAGGPRREHRRPHVLGGSRARSRGRHGDDQGAREIGGA